MSLRAEKKALTATRRKLVQVANDLSKTGGAVVKGVARGTMIVQRAAMKGAPVDRGHLRASITPEIVVRDDVVRGVVGSNRVYAAAQELGSKPFWMPFQPILRWAMRKLKTRKKSKAWFFAKNVQKKIARYGIKAKKFLYNAYLDNKDRIVKILDRAVKRSVDE